MRRLCKSPRPHVVEAFNLDDAKDKAAMAADDHVAADKERAFVAVLETHPPGAGPDCKAP